MSAEAYLEPSRISTIGHLCENYKKALLQMFNWDLYVSNISSTVGKVYRMSTFIEYKKSALPSKKFVIEFLVT